MFPEVLKVRASVLVLENVELALVRATTKIPLASWSTDNVMDVTSVLCPAGILKSTCYIDVRWFPFDVQKCDLKFGSWTHNGWLLDLQILAVDISTYIPNGEWDLVGVETFLFPSLTICSLPINDH